MAKPLRSPVVGYNHNVRYHGRVFHVQSEDSGPAIPRVFTHMFYEGTILVSRKHEYDLTAHEDLVRVQMQQLHKAVIKELTRGEFDAKIAGFFAARGQPAILPDPVGPAAAVPAVVAAAPVAAPVVAPQAPAASPSAVVVQGSGMVTDGAGDKRNAPRPGGTRPQGIPRQTPPVLKPGDLKRPPVVLSSSADGVVVQRNVVIGVGGSTPNPSPLRPVRIRPPVPYVVREGSYANGGNTPPPTDGDGTAPRVQIVTPTPSPASAPVAAKAVPAPTWDNAHVTAPDRRTPHYTPPSERTFGNELVSDKSLDEVILEYLSDDSETDES
jgi:hypothetical protein